MAGPCPRCGWPILTLKVTKAKGAEIVCPQPECKHSEPLDDAAQGSRAAGDDDAKA